MLDWALAYANLGWHVLPLHGIIDGRCTCGVETCGRSAGKHPRIKTGANHAGAATTNEATIRGWWKRWPDSNIGVMTGPISGLAVLDVDGERGMESLNLIQDKIGPMPDTVCSQTGSGGYHFLNQHPGEEHRVVNRAHAIGPCLDIRGNGGLFVLPPSVHLSGERYRWVVAPGEAELASFDWLDRSIKWADAEREKAKVPMPINSHRTATPDRAHLLHRASLYLEKMNPSISGSGGHGALWQAALAMVRGFELGQDDALHLLATEFNPRCQPKWSECELRHKVAQATDKAEKASWGYLLVPDPMVEHGAEVAAAWESNQRKRAAEALADQVASTVEESEPVDIIPRQGLIRDIVEWILSTSIRPQPNLAVAAAVSFLGVLAGRKYESFRNSRTNVYMIGVANSGAGKDHAVKCIRNLAHLSNTLDYLGGERIASGPGLISALKRKPAQLFMLDEFGIMLSGMTNGKADSHKRELMSTLLTIYSRPSITYVGTEYADQEKRPRVEIVQPHVCIYGTTTPEQFYSAITSMQGVDGSNARMVVVHADDKMPDYVEVDTRPPPPGLVQAVRELAEIKAEASGNLSNLGGSSVDTVETIGVPFTPDVMATNSVLARRMDLLADDKTKDASARSIYSRVAENAIRLALIHAVSRDIRPSAIDSEDYQWAARFALWAAEEFIKKIGELVADNETEALHKKVAGIVRRSGKIGISRRDLTRKCQSIRRRDLDEILLMLEQAGLIISTVGESTGGRKPVMYFPSK